MQDPLHVGVLHAGAHLAEERQPLGGRQLVLVAVRREGRAFDVLHHEVRLAALRRSGVEHARDVVVTHAREGRALGLEAPQHRAAVHSELDDLQGDPTHERLALLGQVDDPHAALAEDLQDRIGANVGRMGCGIVDHVGDDRADCTTGPSRSAREPPRGCPPRCTDTETGQFGK